MKLPILNIYSNILNILESYDLNVKNFRGQGNGGTSPMNGNNSSVQKRISSIILNVPFIHCCAHDLKLVISDATKNIQYSNNFFTTIQAIINFISSRTPFKTM